MEFSGVLWPYVPRRSIYDFHWILCLLMGLCLYSHRNISKFTSGYWYLSQTCAYKKTITHDIRAYFGWSNLSKILDIIIYFMAVLVWLELAVLVWVFARKNESFFQNIFSWDIVYASIYEQSLTLCAQDQIWMLVEFINFLEQDRLYCRTWSFFDNFKWRFWTKVVLSYRQSKPTQWLGKWEKSLYLW